MSRFNEQLAIHPIVRQSVEHSSHWNHDIPEGSLE
jgi:hypothetical protein